MARIAVFDLDGTLVDSAPAIHRALALMCHRRGLPAPALADVQGQVSLGVARLVAHALRLDGVASTEDITAFRACYALHTGTADDLYAGIPKALAQLHAAGVVMGVCTNKPQALAERVLQDTGIARYFTAVVGGDTTPAPKPDAAHLQHTLRRMGCSGQPCHFIGDSSVDARVAAACGARFLWASWGYPDVDSLPISGLCLATPDDLVPSILHGDNA